MPWQLRDPHFREAIRLLVEEMNDQCALAGAVGAQVHVARKIGIDKLGPPARAIEVVAFDGATAPGAVRGIPIRVVDALGFEPSVDARRVVVDLDGEHFPVAAAEHILGIRLGAPDLPPEAKWACFVLMRVLEGQLDLEEVRGFLKRAHVPGRQELLAELAYLAA